MKINEIQVVVLAAGNLEESFNLSGFKSPKNLIHIDRTPMLAKIINNYLELGFKDLIVAIRKEEEMIYKSSQMIANFVHSLESLKFVFVPDNDGPITTALLCADYIDPQKKIIFVNGDLLITADNFYQELLKLSEFECGFFHSRSFEDRWSYLRLQDGYPIEIKPKGVISDTYAIGVYYFHNLNTFLRCAEFVLINLRGTFNYLHFSNTINTAKMFTRKIYGVGLDHDKFVHLASPGDLRKYLFNKPS
jgi:dTDP-glucose pyrophosphorylase